MSLSRGILILVLATLLLRLALVPYYASKPLFSDFQVYASDAERIVRGEAIFDEPELASRAPAYPLLLAAIFWIFGNSLAAVYTIQAIAWSGTGLLTWAWARGPLGERGALLAAGCVLLHPDGIVSGGLTGVECLAALLLSAILWRFTRACEGPLSNRRAFLDGALAGVGVLTVATFALLVVLSLALVAFVRLRRGLACRRLILVPVGMALVISPWSVRNTLVVGGFVPLTTIVGAAILGGNNPAADGEWNQDYVALRRAEAAAPSVIEWNRLAEREVLDFILAHPGRWLILEAKKFAKFFSPKPGSFYRGRFFSPYLELAASPAFWIPIMLLLPFGVVRARQREPAVLLAVLGVACLLLNTLVFFALVRHRIPFLPAFSVLAAIGADRVRNDWTGVRGRRTVVLAAWVGWAVFLVCVWTWVLAGRWGMVRAWIGGA